ncbi:MAG: TetR/AcrR family transcriptional regulator [Acholeplasmataceae bacterium]
MKITTEKHIKERIITATIDLIKDSDGLIENITIRKIAESADVALGLINYYFDSKDKLIEVCVERIISNVMKVFPNIDDLNDYKDANKDITSFTINVFKFLLNNPEISKISMLSDLKTPKINSNSSISYKAILRALPDKYPEAIKRVKAFIFLATIQSAFLNKDTTSELLGINLNNKEDYTKFFNLVSDILNIN